MKFEQQLLVEGVRTVVTLLVLLVTWRFGQPILARWDERKKRRELDIALSAEFQKLFGEYKEVWRLWKAHYVAAKPASQGSITADDSTRWDLFRRAAAAEGRVESIFVKLAVDRPLAQNDLQMLGYFRQAYQVLRQGIRDGEHLNYTHDDPPYELFNVLGCWVAHIINRESEAQRPGPEKAQESLVTIQSYRGDDWKDAVAAWTEGAALPITGSSAVRILATSTRPRLIREKRPARIAS